LALERLAPTAPSHSEACHQHTQCHQYQYHAAYSLHNSSSNSMLRHNIGNKAIHTNLDGTQYISSNLLAAFNLHQSDNAAFSAAARSQVSSAKVTQS